MKGLSLKCIEYVLFTEVMFYFQRTDAKHIEYDISIQGVSFSWCRKGVCNMNFYWSVIVSLGWQINHHKLQFA